MALVSRDVSAYEWPLWFFDVGLDRVWQGCDLFQYSTSQYGVDLSSDRDRVGIDEGISEEGC